MIVSVLIGSTEVHGEAVRTATSQASDPLVSCGRMLLSGIASSVLVLRRSERIAFANKAAEIMLGKTTEELEGTELSAIFKEEPSFPRSVSGPATSKRGQLCLHGNTRLPVRITIGPLHNDKGVELGSVVTIENMADMLQMDEYVKQMVLCDTLTGLPKESSLAASLESTLLQLHTTGRSFALLELNIDQFRRIKESLGHDAADGALRETAARLVKATRENDLVTRSSSDAFTILLTDCASAEEAQRRAQAVLDAFKEPFRFGPYCTQVTASIGVSFARPGTATSGSLSTEAELAVRRCKALGGNRVIVFEAAMADWHSQAVQMESQMQSALRNEEFFVVYQPQVCCQTGRVVGVESLLRWKSPEDGLIMPSTFIPAAEESGLIVALGEWCLRTACKEIVSLQQELGYSIRLAVNVSPKQMHSPGFKNFVRKTLEETGLRPELLELEITEGLLISHEEEALKVISSIQELGVSVAMDDFGMGFSNLSYLNRFKIDRLKIDRSFISRCADDHNSRMITTSLVFLAKSLDIEVVAEGVETPAQAAILTELRCDLAQGYLYARPTTVDEIHAMAAKKRPAAARNITEVAPQQAAVPTPEVTPSAPAVAGDSAPTMQTPATPSAVAPLSASASPSLAPTPANITADGGHTAGVSPCTCGAEVVTSIQPPPAATAASTSAAPVSDLPLAGTPEASGPSAVIAPSQEAAAPVNITGNEASSASLPQSTIPDPLSSTTHPDERPFATHTILVPHEEPLRKPDLIQASGPSASAQNPQAAKSRRVMSSFTGADTLEPREPVCRPSRPQRLPGSTRVRWKTVIESDTL